MAGPTGNSCHLFCHFVEFTYCHCVEDTEVECRRGRANIFVWGLKQKLEGRASSTRMLWYVPIKISPSIYTDHKNDEDRFTDVGDSQSVKRSSPCAVQKLRNQCHHQSSISWRRWWWYHEDDIQYLHEDGWLQMNWWLLVANLPALPWRYICSCLNQLDPRFPTSLLGGFC